MTNSKFFIHLPTFFFMMAKKPKLSLSQYLTICCSLLVVIIELNYRLISAQATIEKFIYANLFLIISVVMTIVVYTVYFNPKEIEKEEVKNEQKGTNN